MSAPTLTRPAATAPPAPSAPPAPRRRTPFAQRGFSGLLRTEARVWMRDPSALFFGLVFPTVLIAGITLMNPAMTEPMDAAGVPAGVTGVQLFMPAVLTMAIATPFLTIMPAVFGGFREKGVLRRFSGSPMRPQALVVVHYLVNLAVVVVATLAAVLITHLAWGLTMPNDLATVVLAFVLGTTSVAALATLISARAPRASVASGFGTTLYFVLLITSGVFTGPVMNETFAAVARFSPLGAAAQAMITGWFEQGFPLLQVVVMVAWTAVLLPIGVKLFRWS